MLCHTSMGGCILFQILQIPSQTQLKVACIRVLFIEPDFWTVSNLMYFFWHYQFSSLFSCFRPQPDASNPTGCCSFVAVCVAAQLDGLWCPQTALWWLEHVGHSEAPVHHLYLLCYAGVWAQHKKHSFPDLMYHLYPVPFATCSRKWCMFCCQSQVLCRPGNEAMLQGFLVKIARFQTSKTLCS